MSEEELHFFQQHLVSLIEMKRFADAYDQFCFQMERLWFYLFKRSASESRIWLSECDKKTFEIETFEKAWRDCATAFNAAKITSDKMEKILSSANSVYICYKALSGLDKNNGAAYEDHDYYHFFSESEKNTLALSRWVLSVVSDLQKRYADGPTIVRI